MARVLSVLGVAGGVGFLLGLPLLLSLPAHGIVDWAEETAHYAAARQTILHFSQFPFWNPYLCGGAPAYANPVSYFLSPTFLSVLLFGPVVGPKLAVPVLIAVGSVGLWLFVRSLGISRAAALVALPVAFGSGFLATRLAAGQFLWLTFAWIPWVLFCYQKSKTSRVWLIAGGMFLMLIGIGGRSYLVLYVVLLLLIVALVDDLRTKGRDRALWRTGFLVLCAFLLGAWKFFPDLLFLFDRESVLPNTPPLSFTLLPKIFLLRDASPLATHAGLERLPWFEYSAYVGIPAALAILFGFVNRRRASRLLPWVIGGAVLLVAAVSPLIQTLFEGFPIVRELRNPQRVLGIIVIVLSLLAAAGAERLQELVRKRLPRQALLVPLLLLGLVVGDLASVTIPALRASVSTEPTAPLLSDVALTIRAPEVQGPGNLLPVPVSAGVTVGQRFVAPAAVVREVRVAVAPPLPPPETRLVLSLQAERGNAEHHEVSRTVAEATVTPGWLSFLLGFRSEHEPYQLTLAAPELSSETPLILRAEQAGDLYPDGALLVGGIEQTGDLGLEIRSALPTAVRLWQWLASLHPLVRGGLFLAAVLLGILAWRAWHDPQQWQRWRSVLLVTGIASVLFPVGLLAQLLAVLASLPEPPPQAFRQTASSDPLDAVLRNQGAVHLCPAVLLAWRGHTAVRTVEYSAAGEVSFRGDGEATLRHFTPNRLTIAVAARRAGRVVVNQNAAPGWRTSLGTIVRTPENLLAVDVPAGTMTVVVSYWPPGLTSGLVVTGATVGALLALLARVWWHRRSPGTTVDTEKLVKQ